MHTTRKGYRVYGRGNEPQGRRPGEADRPQLRLRPL